MGANQGPRALLPVAQMSARVDYCDIIDDDQKDNITVVKRQHGRTWTSGL